ncbi:DUF2207 domain-containing protein [Ectopseudomonas mendocina]|uniref:DUF2207 domain-containing protein n=1 Tax=Ectopseudomonas mendocina TaxID=300 RepID=UPI0005A7FF84|nr:DUF2207 domain-containing protein [Pseudomonas mendocina]VEE18126.1 Uncharacterized conserved protein [Pseudomonas mendocina]
MSGRLRVLLLLCCFCVFGVQAEEVIQAYDVRLQVEPNGEVLVSERIAVVAEGKAIVRGIFRDIPTRYGLGKGLLRNTPLTLISATRDGHPENVAQQALDHGIRLRLGSADTQLEPGPYLYELTYRMDAQLLHHARVDELYWNVTGNDWLLPIRAASVEVVLPKGAQIEAVHGYTGHSGSQAGDYEVLEQADNRLRMATNRPLHAHEGFTVAVAWQAGLVTRPAWWERLLRLLSDNLRHSLLMGTFAVLLGYYARQWWARGRGPARGVVIPLFELSRGISPVMAGYVWRRGLGGDSKGVRALSIMVTDLAIRGWLSLQRHAEGLQLTRTESATDDLREDERQVLNALIPQEGGSLVLGGGYEPRLARALGGLRKSLAVIEQNNFNNHTGQWLCGAFLALSAGIALLLTSTSDAKAAQDALWLVLIAVVLAAAMLQFMSSSIGAAGVIMLFVLGTLGIAAGLAGGGVVLQCVALFAIVAVARKFLRAPTTAGRRLLDELEGYRDYLSLGEKDVLDRAGQAPVMSIALYERHLPYAMALGVEQQWTNRFTSELQKGTLEPVAVDYRPQGFTSLMTSGEARTLAWNLDRVLMSASVPPEAPRSSDDFSSSGSSSGSSASRGGGSSGGGAGGGGGGGW